MLCLCMYCCIINFFALQKPLGLLSLLDEESTFPKATDFSFANKLKQHLRGNSAFRGEQEGAFKICHYAGEVGDLCWPIFPLFHCSHHFLHLCELVRLPSIISFVFEALLYTTWLIVQVVFPGDVWYNWFLGEEQRSVELWVNSTTLIM